MRIIIEHRFIGEKNFLFIGGYKPVVLYYTTWFGLLVMGFDGIPCNEASKCDTLSYIPKILVEVVVVAWCRVGRCASMVQAHSRGKLCLKYGHPGCTWAVAVSVMRLYTVVCRCYIRRVCIC